MRKTLAIVVVSIALVLSSSLASDVWDMLSNRTGWILLGDLNVAEKTWGTQVHHEIKERKKKGNSIIPGVGDRLRVTIDLQLIILGYQTRGEADRLVSPAGRVLTREDLVGVVAAGSVVEVLAVSRERPIGNLQGIWVRIAPSK